uniref:Aluminum-activated malate transporter n=1 Tax=Aegilops tauschii subsp. strangulata TaxID=200361 RepID=A0A453BYI0_AEGTS
GAQGEPILLAIFVFLLASAATFSRFIPEIKARYDYGVTIFILTFSLVAVSSYRVEELIQLAHQRFSTIVIGVLTCLCTTIFVFPVWAGEDLHKLTAGNLDKLAQFLQGLESECFGEKAAGENLEGKAFLQVYKSVLNSKASEDSLVSFLTDDTLHYTPSAKATINICNKTACIHSSFCNVILKIAVQFCQMGARSWQIRLPTPMEPIPEARSSLSSVRVFNGGSCFLCHHTAKVPVP